MYVSDFTYLYLRQAEDERQSRELEYRRKALERAAETGPTVRRGLREFLHPFCRSEPVPQRRLSHS